MAGAGSGGSTKSPGYRYIRLSCACACHAVRQAEVHGKSVCRLRGRGLVLRDCSSYMKNTLAVACLLPPCSLLQFKMYFWFARSALSNTGGGAGGGGNGAGGGVGGSGIVVVKCYNC